MKFFVLLKESVREIDAELRNALTAVMRDGEKTSSGCRMRFGYCVTNTQRIVMAFFNGTSEWRKAVVINGGSLMRRILNLDEK